jgi:hypothetical protein
MLRLLSVVRAAEILTGTLALLFLLGLPFPPDERHRFQWVYLGVVAAGALVLAWRVGRGGRAVWYAVVALAVLVLGTLLVHFGEWGALFHSPAGVSHGVSNILVALYGLGQLVALLCAVSVLRRSAADGEPVAPTN